MSWCRCMKQLHCETHTAQMLRCEVARAAELTQNRATIRRPTRGAGPPPSSHALTEDALPPPPFPPLPPFPAACPLTSACCLLLGMDLQDDNAYDRLGGHRRRCWPPGDSRLAAHCRMHPLCMHAIWRAFELNLIFWNPGVWVQQLHCGRLFYQSTALLMRLVAEDATTNCSMGSNLSGLLPTGTQDTESTDSHKSLRPAVSHNTD